MTQNPYAAPQSETLVAREGMSPGEAQRLRTRFRPVERLIRSIGIVYFAQALFVTVVAFDLLTTPVGDDWMRLSAGAYSVLLAVLLMVAGFGLRTLAPWSRLTALLQTMYLLSGFAFGLIAIRTGGQVAFVFAVLHALPFYVLFSSRAAFVLSTRYLDAVALTPGRKPGSFALAACIIALMAGLIVFDTVILEPLWRAS